MIARVSKKGVRFAARFEGYIPCARDIGDGVLTVGHGTTEGSGRRIHRGLCISREKARKWLRSDLNRRYLSAVPRRRRMKQQEKDALASFAYNLGPGAVSDPNHSTLARRLKSKEGRTFKSRKRIYNDELEKWISPGTQFEAGLRKRREAERRLASYGDYSGRP